MKNSAAVFAVILSLPPLALGQPIWTKAVPQPDAPSWRPLSQKERVHLYLKDAFGPENLFAPLLSSGVAQLRDRPPEWGQGMEGYGKRYGNYLAKSGLRTTLRFSVAEILKEDTRYIALRSMDAQATAKQRIWFATTHTYAAWNRGGKRRFSVAKLVANGGTSALSRYWAPPRWQGGRRIAVDFAISSGMQAGFNIIREFSPDLLRKLKKGP